MPLLRALSHRLFTPREPADRIVDRMARTLTEGSAPRRRGSEHEDRTQTEAPHQQDSPMNAECEARPWKAMDI
jgi:hypothetical protein